MKMKIMKDEAKTITFGTTGCLLIFALIGVCIGATVGIAVAVYRFIAG